MTAPDILNICICSLFGVLGIVILCGAVFKWKWLVDPDEKYADVYSQAKLKKLLGQKFLLAFTYILGIAFIIISVWLIGQVLLYPAGK